jgi:hypothetical protein
MSGLRFDSRKLQTVSVFNKTSRPALRPVKTLFNEYRGESGLGVKLTAQLHLVPRLGMSAATVLLTLTLTGSVYTLCVAKVLS